METQPKCNRRKENIKLAIIKFQLIQNKVPEFETFTTTCQPDFIRGTESWLTLDVGNIVFHKDRVVKTCSM